jgi:hypothetical protein
MQASRYCPTRSFENEPPVSGSRNSSGSRHSDSTTSSSFETMRSCTCGSSESNCSTARGVNFQLQSSLVILVPTHHLDDFLTRDQLCLPRPKVVFARRDLFPALTGERGMFHRARAAWRRNSLRELNPCSCHVVSISSRNALLRRRLIWTISGPSSPPVVSAADIYRCFASVYTKWYRCNAVLAGSLAREYGPAGI